MASKSPQVLLYELDKLLHDTPWRGPPSDLDYLTDPDHLLHFQKVVLGGAYYDTMAEWIGKQVEQTLEALRKKESFHVCSVGCGDGVLDKKIIGMLSAAHPSLAIHYVGVGLCEQGCEEVERKMEDVGDNVVVQVVASDYSDISIDEVGRFDCVLMTSSLCYSTAPEATLESVLQLVKPNGQLIVVSSNQQSFDELISRFWKHQRNYNLCTTEWVRGILEKMGKKYSEKQLPVMFDLSQCFNDQFKSDQSKLILDHIMQVNMDEYDPAIRELVICFLNTIAVGQSENGIIESLSDMIIINNSN